MATRQGEFDEVDATASETIQGAITDRVIVRSGVALMVQGSVTGEVVIEADATLIVQGSFIPDSVDNQGALAVAGTTDVDPRDVPGHFVVSPNTVLTFNNPPVLVRPDGSMKLLEPAPEHHLSVNADEFVVWDRELGQFSALTSDHES